MSAPFDYADKRLEKLKTYVSAEFQNATNQMSIDELNVITVKDVVEPLYKRLRKRAEREFKDITRHEYRRAYKEVTGVAPEKDDDVTDIAAALAFTMLKEYSSVTQYAFVNEHSRKRDRLVEAILSAQAMEQVRDVFNKAARSWYRQTKQYADISVEKARAKAFEDCNVEYVMWRTENDKKVCSDCNELNREVFKREEAPQPPLHRNCRCWLEAVKV